MSLQRRYAPPTWSGHSVVGIDPSTRSMAFLDLSANGLSCRYQLVKLPSTAYEPYKAKLAADALRQFLSNMPPNQRPQVFIEHPVLGRGGAGPTVVQAFVNGALQLVTQDLGLPCRTVNNTTWKLRVIGNGRAKKEHVAACARRDWVLTYPGLATLPGISAGTASEDLLDAAGIAIYGLRALLRRVKLAQPSRMQRRR